LPTQFAIWSGHHAVLCRSALGWGTGSCSDEKRTRCHAMQRWLPTRLFSCTYTTDPRKNSPPPPSSYLDACRRQRRAVSKRKVVQGDPSLFVSQQLLKRSFPSFFPFSFFLSFYNMKNVDIHTTFGAAFIGITSSSLYASTALLSPVVYLGCRLTGRASL